VTIDFFANPGDRSTATLHRYLTALHQRHPRRVRVIYRLVAAGRAHDLAVAMLEAFAQDRFQPFFDAAMARTDPPLARESILALCREVGVDPVKVEAAWQGERHAEALYRNEGARKRRTDAAPSILFNGRDLGRATSMNLDKLEAHYRATYEQAQATLDRGVPLERLYTVLVREHTAEQIAKIPRDFLGAVDGMSASALHKIDTAPRLVRQDIDVPGHELGSADAPVTVRVYCNFLSANCAMLRTSLATLREEFPDEVRVIFHHMFPELPPETDPARVTAIQRDLVTVHRAALCADAQGAFWDFYKLVYQPQAPQARNLDVREQMSTLVASLPVDAARFQACMSAPGGDEAVMDRVRAARKAGIAHTPTVVIGGRAYLGFKSSLDLRALVEEELLPGLLERALPAPEDESARFSRDAE
jgi:predicted DsbA family dithiol-disulfide isomerase